MIACGFPSSSLSFRTEEPGQKPTGASRPAARRHHSSDDDGEAEQVFPVSLRSLMGEQVGLSGDANVGSTQPHKRAVRFHADEPAGRGKSPASAASEASGPNEDDGEANGHPGSGTGRDSPIDDDRSTPGAPAVAPKRGQKPRPPPTPYSTTPPPPPPAAPAPVTSVDVDNKRAAAAPTPTRNTPTRNTPVAVDTRAPTGLGGSTTTSRRNVLNFGPAGDTTDTPRHLLADMTFTAGGGMSHASMISHLACPAQITGARSTRALPVQEEDEAGASDAPVTFVFNS